MVGAAEFKDDWFSDPRDLEFATAVNAVVTGWRTPPTGLRIDPPTGDFPLVAWMDVIADGVAILTVGVHFFDDRIVCDEVHNQLTSLEPTEMERRAVGSPALLAEVAGDWLLSVVARPYRREEWVHRRSVYAFRYVVADSGQPLCGAFDLRSAPRRFSRRADRARFSELGPVDRGVAVDVEY
ncbi:hypothetical protein [Oerskovia paurometabola]|uniref:hypothetical protein n=1 Tax=Oerskovia paurometabola TaxID=162170 RepID=UPI0037FD1282